MKDETEKILDIIESIDDSTEIDASEALQAAEFAQATADTALELAQNVKINTKEYWNSLLTLVAEEGVVYIYSNQYIDSDTGLNIPGFKVGDGTSYLIDMPFNDDIMAKHILDTTIHVTSAEKTFWNNKVTAYLNASDLEDLVLTKN